MTREVWYSKIGPFDSLFGCLPSWTAITAYSKGDVAKPFVLSQCHGLVRAQVGRLVNIFQGSSFIPSFWVNLSWQWRWSQWRFVMIEPKKRLLLSLMPSVHKRLALLSPHVRVKPRLSPLSLMIFTWALHARLSVAELPTTYIKIYSYIYLKSLFNDTWNLSPPSKLLKLL